MKITICQIESKPIQIKKNSQKILKEIKKARNEESDLVIFPELTLTGYSCMDKFLDENFIQDNLKELKILAKNIRQIDQNISTLIGFVDIDKKLIAENGLPPRYNAIALIQNGKIQKVFHKTLLPEYDIFNEKRYFKSGDTDNTFTLKNLKIGIQICEDLWDKNYQKKPTEHLVNQGAELIINLSGSPFEINKFLERKKLILEKVDEFKIPFIYVNQVGSQDNYDGQIIFDGRSLVFDKNGKQVIQGKSFEEDILEFPIPINPKISTNLYEQSLVVAQEGVNKLSNTQTPPLLRGVGGDFFKEDSKECFEVGGHYSSDISENDEIIKAITLGIKTYFEENNFEKIFIGISGGIDSALVTTLSILAVGKDKVEGVIMPSEFTSKESLDLAEKLIKNLGIKKRILPITESLEIVRKTFTKNNFKLQGLADENTQARLRGAFLMALANSKKGLVLTTSNKTEMALGYSTLYGDMCGGLAPISDLSKQKVIEICNYLNNQIQTPSFKGVACRRQGGGCFLIPEKIITRKPTAELRENQTDEESLGIDYKILSPLVDDLIERSNSTNLKDLEKKYGKENVIKIQNLIQKSEFKRRQAPPGIKLTSKAFGLGRREPF